MEYLTHYGFWIILGLVLLILEFTAPSLLLVFFGIGAIITSALTLAGIVSTLEVQILVFIVISVAVLFILRRKVARWMSGKVSGMGDQELDSTGLVGMSAVITSDFTHGRGRVELNGTGWDAQISDESAEAESIKVGDRVRVDRLVGNTLHVSK